MIEFYSKILIILPTKIRLSIIKQAPNKTLELIDVWIHSYKQF